MTPEERAQAIRDELVRRGLQPGGQQREGPPDPGPFFSVAPQGRVRDEIVGPSDLDSRIARLRAQQQSEEIKRRVRERVNLIPHAGPVPLPFLDAPFDPQQSYETFQGGMTDMVRGFREAGRAIDGALQEERAKPDLWRDAPGPFRSVRAAAVDGGRLVGRGAQWVAENPDDAVMGGTRFVYDAVFGPFMNYDDRIAAATEERLQRGARAAESERNTGVTALSGRSAEEFEALKGASTDAFWSGVAPLFEADVIARLGAMRPAAPRSAGALADAAMAPPNWRGGALAEENAGGLASVPYPRMRGGMAAENAGGLGEDVFRPAAPGADLPRAARSPGEIEAPSAQSVADELLDLPPYREGEPTELTFYRKALEEERNAEIAAERAAQEGQRTAGYGHANTLAARRALDEATARNGGDVFTPAPRYGENALDAPVPVTPPARIDPARDLRFRSSDNPDRGALFPQVGGAGDEVVRPGNASRGPNETGGVGARADNDRGGLFSQMRGALTPEPRNLPRNPLEAGPPLQRRANDTPLRGETIDGTDAPTPPRPPAELNVFTPARTPYDGIELPPGAGTDAADRIEYVRRLVDDFNGDEAAAIEWLRTMDRARGGRADDPWTAVGRADIKAIESGAYRAPASTVETVRPATVARPGNAPGGTQEPGGVFAPARRSQGEQNAGIGGETSGTPREQRAPPKAPNGSSAAALGDYADGLSWQEIARRNGHAGADSAKVNVNLILRRARARVGDGHSLEKVAAENGTDAETLRRALNAERPDSRVDADLDQRLRELRRTGETVRSAAEIASREFGRPVSVGMVQRASARGSRRRANLGSVPGDDGIFAPAPRNESQAPGALDMSTEARMARAKAMGFTTPAFHGTDADISKFKRRMNDIGIHFGTAGQANDRLEYLTTGGRTGRNVEGSSVYPALLRLKKPLRTSDMGAWDAQNLEYGLADAGIPKEEIQRAMRSSRSPSGQIKALQELLKRKGYDGIVYKNTGEVEGSTQFRIARDEAWSALMAAQKARGRPLNVFDLADQQTPEYQAYLRAEENATQFREANGQDSYIVFDPSNIRSIHAAFDPARRNSSDLLASYATPVGLAATGGALAVGMGGDAEAAMALDQEDVAPLGDTIDIRRGSWTAGREEVTLPDGTEAFMRIWQGPDGQYVRVIQRQNRDGSIDTLGVVPLDANLSQPADLTAPGGYSAGNPDRDTGPRPPDRSIVFEPAGEEMDLGAAAPYLGIGLGVLGGRFAGRRFAPELRDIARARASETLADISAYPKPYDVALRPAASAVVRATPDQFAGVSERAGGALGGALGGASGAVLSGRPEDAPVFAAIGAATPLAGEALLRTGPEIAPLLRDGASDIFQSARQTLREGREALRPRPSPGSAAAIRRGQPDRLVPEASPRGVFDPVNPIEDAALRTEAINVEGVPPAPGRRGIEERSQGGAATQLSGKTKGVQRVSNDDLVAIAERVGEQPVMTKKGTLNRSATARRIAAVLQDRPKLGRVLREEFPHLPLAIAVGVGAGAGALSEDEGPFTPMR